jgi:hypothetical protein
MTMPNGNVYQGQFSRGLRYGHGTYSTQQGTVIEGDWIDDVLNGYARVEWADKSTFEGIFKDNRIANGKFKFPSGNLFTGSFDENGKFDGEGTMVT